MAAERKTEFAGSGVIKKCPNCGAQIEAFQARCPACGFAISGVEEGGSAALKKFLNKYEKGGRWKQADMVNTFPIPNTVEDIIEFVIFGAQQMKVISQERYEDGAENLCVAWGAKLEEAKNRALISFSKDDPQLANLETLIADSMKYVELTRKNRRKSDRKDNRELAAGCFGCAFVLLGIPFLIYIGITSAGPRKIKAETTRLEKLTTEIQGYIAEGNYGEAELKIPDVRWTYTKADDREKFEATWESKQQTLQKQLEEAKKGKK